MRQSGPRQGVSPGAETLEGYAGWWEIGRGGDAVVYHATQNDLGREVAIKVLRVDDEASVRRFTREARLMLSLGRQHPNMAKVLQIGTSSLGRPCIVMDFYELGSLDKRLVANGPLGADEVIGIGSVIADALAFAHANGVLHLDVKPQNILILPTSYVLADFGIARLTDTAHPSDEERYSYRHSSPQVLDAATPSESDDVFSLGATMFHLLDGRPPFSAASGEPDSALSYSKRVRKSEPRALLRPDVPRELAAIIQKCLRKDPAERYASAAAVRDALAPLHRGWPGVAYADTRSERGIPAGLRTAAEAVPAAGPVPVCGPVSGSASGPVSGSGSVSVSSALGWSPEPGAGHSTADLTALRLRGAGDGSPELEADTAPPPRTPRRRPVVVGGTVMGALLALVGWGAVDERGGRQSTGLTPGTARSAVPGAQAIADIPDLAPRELRITIEGDTATATWARSLAVPDAWGWGVTRNESDRPVISHTNVVAERVARVRMDPADDRICFTVVGVRGSQLSGARACAVR